MTARLPVTLLANDPEVYADTERLHRPAQHRTAKGVELHVHQVAHAVDDVDGQPVLQQAARRLQAEQPPINFSRQRVSSPASGSQVAWGGWGSNPRPRDYEALLRVIARVR